MEINDLWLTCLIYKVFWPATLQTRTTMFVIAHGYTSSVRSPHIPTFRALTFMADDRNCHSVKVSPKEKSHRLICSVQSVRWPISPNLWWAVWVWEITLGPKVSCRKSEAMFAVCGVTPSCMNHLVCYGNPVVMSWGTKLLCCAFVASMSMHTLAHAHG